MYASARKAGILPKDAKKPPRVDHVGFGLVLSADRKRIATRSAKKVSCSTHVWCAASCQESAGWELLNCSPVLKEEHLVLAMHINIWMCSTLSLMSLTS